jgi:RHS repeat-associated protein
LQQPTSVWTNGFSYDLAGRYATVTSRGGTFTYYRVPGTQGLISGISLPNLSFVTNFFDGNARLTATYLETSVYTILDSAIYGYNHANQRTAFTNAAGTYVQYRYDNIGQLTVADSSTNSEDRGYTYDHAWNLNWLTNNGSTFHFLPDTKNELTNAYSSTYGYDANGNVTSGTNGHMSFVYDDENRLIQWFWYGAVSGSCSNGAVRTDFSYDGLGRLRRRVEYSATNSAPPPGIPGALPPSSPDCFWSLGPEVRYIYDGNRAIQERDGNNNLEVSYTLGPDLSGTLEGAGGIGGLLARSDQYSSGNPTRHNYYHADGGGNITYMVNSSQGLAASYRYDPFGNTVSSSGTLAPFNLYRFSSKEVHANSGMYHYLYRFYDPKLQRWLNRDPLGEEGGINLYGFVANDPVGYIDPYGEWWLDDRIHDIGTVVADAMWGDMQGRAPGNSYIAQRGKLLGPTEDVLTPTVAGGTELALNAGKEIAESYLMGKAAEIGLNLALAAHYKWIDPLIAKAVGASPRVCQAARVPALGACFVKGTEVAAEGGGRPIEEVQVGDRVWAWNEDTGEVSLKEVVNTMSHDEVELVQVELDDVSVEATTEHPFWVEKVGWTGAAHLKIGDTVKTLNGPRRVTKVQTYSGAARVFNLEIAELHTYFVSSVGILVHNAGNSVVGNAVPKVTDPKLANIVNDLYKGARGPKPIGTGSTADAVRNELATGLPTHGKWHSQKAQEYINALNNWLNRNPSASYGDRLVAESLRGDLQSALRGN